MYKTLAFLAVGAAAVCVSFSAWAQSGAPARVYQMRVTTPLPQSDPSSQAALHFKELVERSAKGQVQISVFYGGQLGSGQSVVDQTKDGTIQMTFTATSYLAKYFQDVQVFGLPFAYKDEDQLHRVLDGPLGTDLKEKILAKTGLRILGIGEYGVKAVFNRRRPIAKLEDFSGLKLRAVPSPINTLTFQSLQASPVPMDFSEVYTSVSQGVLDGGDLPPASIEATKMQEVAPYISLTEHFNDLGPFLMNGKFFDSLPPDLQKIIIDAGKQTEAFNRDMVKKSKEISLKNLAAKGAKINIVAPEERAKMRRAVQPVYDKVIAGEFGADGARWAAELAKLQ